MTGGGTLGLEGNTDLWFERLTGFEEKTARHVRENIVVAGETMTSTTNGRDFACGRLETPTLAELRERVARTSPRNGKLRLAEVVADVQALHVNRDNAGALFQVASQFNLLEMVSPSITPEDGVDIYENDRTQGPACAIACGAGTIFRNYFAPVNGRPGQTHDNQIDCLCDLGVALDNTDDRLWVMRNGYAMATDEGLREITEKLSSASEAERDVLRGKLRIGIQWDTQVTLSGASHTVSQAYCSAVPVAYSPHTTDSWAAFAQLVLEASYEATMCAALLNNESSGSNKSFLTLLGGGAFGNRDEWILSAIEHALRRVADVDLDVAIVSYGSSQPRVQELVERWRA